MEFIENIAEIFERLKINGYKVDIDKLKISSLKTKDDRKMTIVYKFTVYHPDDKIPLKIISDSKKL